MILYVETNLIMAIAKGQDKEAEEMLKYPPTGVDLIMPSLCYMEAIIALENERKQRTIFLNHLDIQINEESRNLVQHPSLLLTKLREAKLSYEKSLNDFHQCFVDAINLVCNCHQLNLIELRKDSIVKTFNQPIFKKDKQLRDNLILQCILDHAQQYPSLQKALLTNNSKEFGKQDIKEILQEAGINKYFPKTADFLGWFKSQNVS